LFTGYRWENRFRLLPGERWINPVLYFESKNINGGDRSLLEIVNRDGNNDLRVSNAAPIIKAVHAVVLVLGTRPPVLQLGVSFRESWLRQQKGGIRSPSDYAK
jgi:hypothetical protein